MICTIRLEELAEDAAKFCDVGQDEEERCGGLLVVGGDSEKADLLRRAFVERTSGKYPVFVESKEQYDDSGDRVREGVTCYAVDLSQIVLVNSSAQ